jgi:hypothetical protein
MYNKPTEKQLAKIPALYSTEKVPLGDKIVYVHFFLGGNDWWIVEYSPKDRMFFGYTVINQDTINGEWGYIYFDDLIGYRTKSGFEVDRDLHWKSCKASEIKGIKC